MITLYIGQDRVKYHAHEDTLCQLPFFQAALQGQFKEAETKTIDMPEDDPDAVAALLEWLYTGKYSYEGIKLHENTMKRGASESLEPSLAFLQGLFHLEVFVVACKYDCPTLEIESRKSYYKSHQQIFAIDSLRLFKAACTANARLPPVRVDPYSPENVAALVVDVTKRWVQILFEHHDEEIQNTLEEFPALATGILRITTFETLHKTIPHDWWQKTLAGKE